MAIRAVIFDFGGVFTFPAKSAAILRGYDREMGLPEGTLHEMLYTDEPWLSVSTGRISEEEYMRRVLARLDGPAPEGLAAFSHGPFAFEGLNRQMVDIARELRARYRTALLSNATVSLDRLLDQPLGLTHLFDEIVISAVVGLRKPDPRVYRLTVERLGVSAGACLFIDDRERNTVAAEKLGIPTAIFQSVSQLIRDLGAWGLV